MRRSVVKLSIPLREPFVTASGVLAARELLLLRLEDEDGVCGYGEAAPFEPYDGVSIESVAAAEACDVVNVKLASCGGFAGARETLRAARAHGMEPFLSSTFDGPWGIAAALQLAASERVSLACGLATLELFDAALARALRPPRHGLLAVPQGPGLGVTIDDLALAEVLVEELE